MKKTTLNHSKKLTKRLSQYGALSIAIAGVADASGQINYTDIADVTLDGTSNSYALDLDNDASGDYLLSVQPNDSLGNPTTSPAAFIFPATGSNYNSNGIVGFSASGYNYPSNLNSGAAISAGNTLMPASARGDMNWSSCAYPNSQFCDGQDAFMGFHFKIGTDTHYGWARVQVASNPFSMIVKDYAYNETAGASIDAGQTTLGIEDNQLSDIKIVALNKSIALYNLTTNTNYRLFSITGQQFMQGEINSDTHVIEASKMANGIYIIELMDSETNATLRKKILL